MAVMLVEVRAAGKRVQKKRSEVRGQGAENAPGGKLATFD